MNVLLIEDNDDHASSIREDLQFAYEGSVQIKTAPLLRDGLNMLEEWLDAEILLGDLNLPDSSCTDTTDKLVELNISQPVVVLTSLADLKIAKRLLKKGIQDYVTKDNLSPELLFKACEYALERKKAQRTLDAEVQEKKFFLPSTFARFSQCN